MRREMTTGIGQVPSGRATIRAKQYDLPVGRLESWMRDHVGGFRGPLAAERFEGGQSNPTYKLFAGTEEYVLYITGKGRVIRNFAGNFRRMPISHSLRIFDDPTAWADFDFDII
jgi:hypothetical protein